MASADVSKPGVLLESYHHVAHTGVGTGASHLCFLRAGVVGLYHQPLAALSHPHLVIYHSSHRTVTALSAPYPHPMKQGLTVQPWLACAVSLTA